MDKDKILEMAQKENRGKDEADLAAQKNGAYLAYFVGLFAVIIWDVVEGIIYHQVNFGGNMCLFLMAFTAFIVKYVQLKKTHELIIAVIYGLGAAAFTVFWILQLCGVV
ncbi:MAG: hypothetical protein J5874_05230 [Oscillospiraceae bacterium]|nr:hypothetical protein [Oscillospiraceae bacterium]